MVCALNNYNLNSRAKSGVNNKVNKFQRMCGTISRTLKGKTQLSSQIKFYKVMAVPVLMYGSKNWSLNRSYKRKIEADELRFLKPMAGHTILDKKEVAT